MNNENTQNLKSNSLELMVLARAGRIEAKASESHLKQLVAELNKD